MGDALVTQSRRGFGLPRVILVIVARSAVGIMRGRHGGTRQVDRSAQQRDQERRCGESEEAKHVRFDGEVWTTSSSGTDVGNVTQL